MLYCAFLNDLEIDLKPNRLFRVITGTGMLINNMYSRWSRWPLYKMFFCLFYTVKQIITKHDKINKIIYFDLTWWLCWNLQRVALSTCSRRNACHCRSFFHAAIFLFHLSDPSYGWYYTFTLSFLNIASPTWFYIFNRGLS